MQRLNIEIKARCQYPERIRSLLQTLGADFIGEDHQVDTYFGVKQGRLKLRQGNIEQALIYYRRKDQPGPKKSEVLLYQPGSGTDLKQVLSAALEVSVIVDKVRSIYFIQNVKFHIDTVKGLGSFVEIEAIDKDGTIGAKRLNEQCRHFMDLLSIDPADLVDRSYSDLLQH